MTTSSWLFESLRPFLYSSSVYSCHLFVRYSASVRSCTMPIFALNVHLVFPIFLKSFLVFPILSFSSISLHCSLKKQSEFDQLCPTLCDPMDCSLPGFSVYGIFQARVLEWVAISFSKGSSRPRDWIRVSGIAGRCFTLWAIALYVHLRRFSCLTLLFSGTLHSIVIFSPFSFVFHFSSQLFVRPSQTNTLPSCIYFRVGWFWSLPPRQCYESPSSPDLVPETTCHLHCIITWDLI